MRQRLAALGAALLAALPIGLAAQTFQGKIRFRTVQIAVEEDDARPESLCDVAVGALMQREGAQVSEATLLINGKLLRSEGEDEARGTFTGLRWGLSAAPSATTVPFELEPEIAPARRSGARLRQRNELT